MKADDAKKEAGGEDKGGAAAAQGPGFSARAGVATGYVPDPKLWVVDSGATHHMTPGFEGRGEFTACEKRSVDMITVASGEPASVHEQGRATVVADGKDGKTPVTLEHILEVPDLHENLLSVPTVDKRGGAVNFFGGKTYLYDDGEVVRASGVLDYAEITGDMEKSGQYMLGEPSKTAGAKVSSATVTGAAALWHRRTFHRALSTLAKAADMVEGLPAKEVEPKPEAGAVCVPCAKGKMTSARHPPTGSTAEVLEVIHSDMCGPFEPLLGGARHFVTVVDERTNIWVATPVRTKSQAGAVLQEKIPELERLGRQLVKRLRTGGARVYATAEFNKWLNEKGINHETTLAYSHQSNGKTERVNRTFKEAVRAALVDAGMGQEFWAEALVAATYAANRMPHAGQDLTLWEALTGERPDVSGLRVWGSKAYALLPPEQQKGMHP